MARRSRVLARDRGRSPAPVRMQPSPKVQEFRVDAANASLGAVDVSPEAQAELELCNQGPHEPTDPVP